MQREIPSLCRKIDKFIIITCLQLNSRNGFNIVIVLLKTTKLSFIQHRSKNTLPCWESFFFPVFCLCLFHFRLTSLSLSFYSHPFNLTFKVHLLHPSLPVCVISLSAMCSAIKFIPLFGKDERLPVSVPDLIAFRVRLIHNTALAFTPEDGCIPAVVMCSRKRPPASLLLLKESTQMEKWQALRRHQPCPHSPAFVFSLPVIIFVFV